MTRSPSQKNTLDNLHSTDFEIEFVKLWVKLEAEYVTQKFTNTMGGVNSKTARAWRVEFKRANLTPKDVVYMRENLHQLENPAFIPNSIQLKSLIAKHNKLCRPKLSTEINPSDLPSGEHTKQQRVATGTMREDCLNLMSDVLEEKRPEVNKSQTDKPSERMVKLIANHNRLLINQGLAPLNLKNCKKIAMA